MKIHAAVLHEGGKRFEVDQVDLADPRDGEVLVKVSAAGICHSDWNLVTGATQHPKPVVTGHEGAGTIEAVGSGVSDLKVGDRVALNWAPGCGTCGNCARQRPALCEKYHEILWTGNLLDGTTRLSQNGSTIYHYCGLACFADHCVVPQASCVPIPDSISMNVAALIGCAVTTGVGAVVNTAGVIPDSTVVVTGLGGVGMSTVMAARLVGVKHILAIDKLESRCKAALDFGATEVASVFTDERFDYVFDTTGVPHIIEHCLQATKPGGKTILIGLPPNDASLNINPAAFVRNERSLLGSYYGTANPPEDFPRFAQWFAEGKLPIDKLVSRTFTLDEINEGYRAMLCGETLRGVIEFS